MGRKSLGFDINPVAKFIAEVKVTPINPRKLSEAFVKLEDRIALSISATKKLRAISELLGQDCLPGYLISYIESFQPIGEDSIAIHSPKTIGGYTEKQGEMDKATITRAKGFIGDREMELSRYPDAIHHINILFNETGKARIFYKYKGNIRFLKTPKKHDQGI